MQGMRVRGLITLLLPLRHIAPIAPRLLFFPLNAGSLSLRRFYPSRPFHMEVTELLLAATIACATLPLWYFAPVAALLCAILLPIFRCIRTGRCKTQYRREPSSCRVAIVGAGWSGLAIAARLREVGMAFQGFEADDDVGGTWHPRRRYAGLRLHTPAYAASFADFPYPRSDSAAPDVRPDGSALHEYIRHFAASNELLRCFAFNTRVLGITYDACKRTAAIRIARSGQKQCTHPPPQDVEPAPANTPADRDEWCGPFDMVIFASVAQQPYTPTLPGRLHGESCHASEASAARVASIVSNKQRVVVVGAGKSACDVVRSRMPLASHST